MPTLTIPQKIPIGLILTVFCCSGARYTPHVTKTQQTANGFGTLPVAREHTPVRVIAQVNPSQDTLFQRHNKQRPTLSLSLSFSLSHEQVERLLWHNGLDVPRPENTPSGPFPQRFFWPLKGGVLGGHFRREHQAVDIDAPCGRTIFAAHAGVVGYAGNEIPPMGNLVVLFGPGGCITWYAHAQQLLVTPSQVVSEGEAIAVVGRTGSALGCHLHFAVKRNALRIDPEWRFSNRPRGSYR